MSAPTTLAEQVNALPAGAGSVSGMGETFAADPYTGTGRFTLPIRTPPGHGGTGPSLALVYSSGAGAGICGVGWSFGVGSIRRRTDRGLPSFSPDDRILLGDDELLPMAEGYYRRRTEGSFARIRHVTKDGQSFWAVTARNGTRSLYGRTDAGRTGERGRTLSWLLEETRDTNGNAVLYTWERSLADRRSYLTQVDWGDGAFRALMTYEERPDILRDARGGMVVTTTRRLVQVEVQVRRTDTTQLYTFERTTLTYDTSKVTGLSLLRTVTRTGIHADGTERSFPATTLSYDEASPTDVVTNLRQSPSRPLSTDGMRLVDLNGNGLPDLLHSTDTGTRLWRNRGRGEFASPMSISAPNELLRADGGVFLSDMTGSGFADWVTPRGVYPNAYGQFGDLRRWERAPASPLQAPNARLTDLDGDGVGDLLVTNGFTVQVYLNEPGKGFDGAPRVAPNDHAVPQLGDRYTRLVDTTGDGFDDLVRLGHGTLEVHQGLGMGRFAPPRRMTLPVPLPSSVEPEHMQLTDVTGTGSADLLVWLGSDLWLYPNGSGEDFETPFRLRIPGVATTRDVEVVDLLGAGSKGVLVTSSGVAWRFYDLFKGGKPDILATVDNGMGGHTSIRYGSSVAHQARDLRAGETWYYPLPFPVRVVDEVVHVDTVTGYRAATRFHYHHGFYDASEREFRGFGVVDQFDTPSLEALQPDGVPVTDGPGFDSSMALIPSRTRRFFGLGISEPYLSMLHPLPLGVQLPRNTVPGTPHAHRALRGVVFREEVYSDDGTAFARRPYAITHHVYDVRQVHGPAHPGRPLCYLPLKTATEAFHTERTTDARRVRTESTYDTWGRVTAAREKGLGRDGTFSSAHEVQQGEAHERYTTTTYLERIEAESDDYDAAYTPVYLLDAPHEVKVFGVGTGSGGSDELLAHSQTFYDGADFVGLGAPGSGTALGVVRGRVSSQRQLVLNTDDVATVMPSGAGAQAALTARGGFDSVANGSGFDLWRWSMRRKYNNDHGMPTVEKDPRGGTTVVSYDGAVGLFPIGLVDAADHPTTLVRGDLPHQVVESEDANGNQVFFTYDPTGLPLTRTVAGKESSPGAGDWSGDPPSHPTEAYTYTFDSVPVQVVTATRQVRQGAVVQVHRHLDGLGQVVQERHTAEPDPATPTTPRYRVTGWQVRDPKGLVLRAYQPTFAGSAAYSVGDVSTAVVQTDYDPLGRPVRVNYPDGTFDSTTYHPWTQQVSDRNDNAGHITGDDTRYGLVRSHLLPHLDTPTQTFLDALGRDIAVAEDNGDASQTTPTLRTTTYVIRTGAFTGVDYHLELVRPLSKNYFVLLHGSVLNASGTASSVGVSADPFGTGGLSHSGNASRLTLHRTTSQANWQGTVTVIESVGDPHQSGFRLLDALLPTLPSTTSATQTTTVTSNAWSDLDQVAIYGGDRGSGGTGGHQHATVKATPSGTDTVTLERRKGSGSSIAASDVTLYVVQWGREHTIQRVSISNSSGGGNPGISGSYTTGTLPTEVTRANTWCTLTGTVIGSPNHAGRQLGTTVVALGNGVAQGATEDTVSVCTDLTSDLDVLVTVHSHPGLNVEWDFIPRAQQASASVTVGLPADPDAVVRDAVSNPAHVSGHRFVFATNAYNGASQQDRARVFAHEDSDTSVVAERLENNSLWSAWVQSIDTHGVQHHAAADWRQSVRVTSYTLDAGAFTGATYELELTHPLSKNYFVLVRGSKATQATNRAGSAMVDQDPFGTGNFGTSSGPNHIRLHRHTAAGTSWEGVVTVVECLGDEATSGFRLVDARAIALPSKGSATEQVLTHTTAAWDDLDQVGVYHDGDGARMTAGGYYYGHAKIVPSGTDTLTLTRKRPTTGTITSGNIHAFVVQWGSEHTIQRVAVSGTVGGALDQTSTYQTASLTTSVPSAESWCFFSGVSVGSGLTSGEQFRTVTGGLGDGVTIPETATEVALGHRATVDVDALVTVHHHPSLRVNHQAITEATGLTQTVTVPYGLTPDDELIDATGNPDTVDGERIVHHHGTIDPSSVVQEQARTYASLTSPDTVTIERTEAGTSSVGGRLQVIDFARVRHPGRRLHVTRSIYNLRDEVVEVHDARGLGTPTWQFAYDMGGRQLGVMHLTGTGARYAVADVADNPIWSRDARAVEVNRTFDVLQRPVQEGSIDVANSGSAIVRRAWSYIAYPASGANHAAAQAKNLYGAIEEVRDADGLRFMEYDHRGLVTKVTHRFWDLDWKNATGAVWEDGSGNALGAAFDPATPTGHRDTGGITYLTFDALNSGSGTTEVAFTTTYDAAGRPLQQDFPEGMKVDRTYNDAGALAGVRVDRGPGGWQDVATDFVYDARGKLDQYDLGNGLRTEHTYDVDLERLLRIYTHDPATSDPAFQDLNYTFDAVGNPVLIRDATVNPTFANNQIIPNTRTFHYDPRYRLVRAQGRKLKTVVAGSLNPLEATPSESDYEAFNLRYAYDEVGNFRVNHETSRKPIHYKAGAVDLYNGTGLEADNDAVDQGNWRYDANGCLTHSPRLQELGYSFDSQPVYVDMGGGTEVRYRRHGDQRVLRLVRKNGVRSLGVYLGPWEYHQRVGTGARAKAVLHVDGAGRHAQAEVVLAGTDSDAVAIWFVHSDHLGSGHVLTDSTGGLLSQEEFLPYGRSSDRRDARNRYRFIGVERDEATGLCMTGPRTYDPVTGRFLQGDPIMQVTSPFEYSSSAPIRRRDPSGYADDEHLAAAAMATADPSAAGLKEAQAKQDTQVAQLTEPLVSMDAELGTDTALLREQLKKVGVEEAELPGKVGGAVAGMPALLPNAPSTQRGPVLLNPNAPRPDVTLAHEGVHSLIYTRQEFHDQAWRLAQDQFGGTPVTSMWDAHEALAYHVEQVIDSRRLYSEQLNGIDIATTEPKTVEATIQNFRSLYNDRIESSYIELRDWKLQKTGSVLHVDATHPAYAEVSTRVLGNIDFDSLPAVQALRDRMAQ